MKDSYYIMENGNRISVAEMPFTLLCEINNQLRDGHIELHEPENGESLDSLQRRIEIEFWVRANGGW